MPKLETEDETPKFDPKLVSYEEKGYDPHSKNVKNFSKKDDSE
ncbi:MAG: hypothetical protein WC819_04970 [Parcubacteria group bacterium]|jgi:hypothetical protein